MQRPKIDQYFADKGINVYYNTLGMTEELVRSYVATFQPVVDSSNAVSSQHVKQQCYETMYDIEPRTKMTGFEQVAKQDRAFREKIVSYLTDVFYGPAMNVAQKSESSSDYKTLLTDSLSKIKDPIIYLSGGIDSELLARALLDANKVFKSMLFLWTDRNGNLINEYEAKYARDFCQKNGLDLEEFTVDVETLWETEEFFEFAKNIQVRSTHVLTHAWAVKMLSEKYPHATHLFGGEVRFMKDVNNTDSIAKIVFLDKIDPPGYDQANAYLVTSFSPSGCSVLLSYNQDGTWAIVFTGSGLPPGPVSGFWTTTPGSLYQFSTNSGGSWFSILGDTLIAGVGVSGGPGEISSGTIPILVRVIGETSPVVSSQIILTATSV